MTIPLQFASLSDGQEVFVWSNCLLDLGTDFLTMQLCVVVKGLSAVLDSNMKPDAIFKSYTIQNKLTLAKCQITNLHLE